MKKAALLLLAALMVFTCLAFAGCGDKKTDDTSSNASSATSVAGTDSKAESTAAEDSQATSSEANDETTAADDTSSAANPNAKQLWVTHYNDGQVEGAGVIFTSSDNADSWWHHVSFKPVDAENGIYEIVETSLGAKNGQGVALAIPEGGFVYAINVGNNYPALAEQNPDVADYKNKPDYTSAGCDACVQEVDSWAVGMVIQFTGLDLETLEVPTDTPDVKWHEDDYVCTATWVEIGG